MAPATRQRSSSLSLAKAALHTALAVFGLPRDPPARGRQTPARLCGLTHGAQLAQNDAMSPGGCRRAVAQRAGRSSRPPSPRYPLMPCMLTSPSCWPWAHALPARLMLIVVPSAPEAPIAKRARRTIRALISTRLGATGIVRGAGSESAIDVPGRQTGSGLTRGRGGGRNKLTKGCGSFLVANRIGLMGAGPLFRHELRTRHPSVIFFLWNFSKRASLDPRRVGKHGEQHISGRAMDGPHKC